MRAVVLGAQTAKHVAPMLRAHANNGGGENMSHEITVQGGWIVLTTPALDALARVGRYREFNLLVPTVGEVKTIPVPGEAAKR